MKTQILSKRGMRCKGSAFVIVMVLTAILMIAGVSITYITSNASFTARKIHTGARALAIAEAGVADQLVHMSTNGGSGYNYWAGGITNTGTLDGGTYSVVARKPSSSINVLITSVGTVGGESRTTVLELIGTSSVDGALIAGGNITLNTAAVTVNGDVHANGNVLNSQGKPDVIGIVEAAGGTIAADIRATGAKNPNAPTFSVLDSVASITPSIVPPFSAWKTLATNGGLYFATNKIWSGATISPTNGVVFVQGNATINGRSTLNGTLVATGSISIDNRFDGQNLSNASWPALVAGFNVSLDNRNTIPGMIFAGNDIDCSNNRDIRGKLVALNNISIRNQGNITPPPSSASGYPQINMGGWLQ